MSYDPQKNDLEMHLEHLGDYSVWGGCRWWMVFVAKTRVSLGFACPYGANGTDDSMPTSIVSKLHYKIDPLF